MASTIVTKNSSTASAVPLTGDLTQGELAVNVTDKKLYTKDSGGTVVKLVGGLGNQEANAVAITGGSVNGTTIGATTASTGAFTTLSASSTTTLSGGTANGVAYLNGSKVVTTGSALTFDGTNFTIGSGGSSGGFPFTQRVSASASPVNAFRITNGSDATFDFLLQTSLGTFGTGLGSLAFTQNGTEGMRLTSTGLGIGTSSPGYKLDVNSGASTTVARLTSTGTSAYLGLTNSGATTYIGNDSTSGSFIIQTPASSFSTKLTLDNTGNLGLGVTPSAWYSTYKALQISSNGSFSTNTDFFAISNNAYTNASANDIYLTTGYAGRYRHVASSGAHQWFTAPSGTAGNAISFTQAMTLDASGNLLLGATSLAFSEKFQMYGNYAVFNNASYTGFIGQGSSLGTGTASDFGIRSSNALAFLTGGATERARIDSSGNLLVGTTTVIRAGKISVSFADASSRGIVTKTDVTTTSAALLFTNPNGDVGNITTSGSATAYNTSSDYRLKHDVAPMTGALAKVAALKPVTYKWNADNSDGEGFIAHELAEVVPQCVTGEKDAVDEEGNPKYQGIDTSFLVATLTAAIQEQQALIQQLTERITALEGK